MKQVIAIIKNNIYIIITMLLAVFCLVSVRTCLSYKHLAEIKRNNIEALNDSIRTYKAKNGQLVSTKLMLEGNLKDMKSLNTELYEQIKNMNVKNPHQGIIYDTNIELPSVDTCWVIEHDTIHNTIQKDFAFVDKYRELEGNVTLNDDTLGLNITKDNVNVDCALVVDKDNRIYVTSSNPYVHFNSIEGFTLPKPKQKRFGVGVQVGYGYDIQKNSLSPYVGVGVSYNLFNF